jgi:hypothetical protein
MAKEMTMNAAEERSHGPAPETAGPPPPPHPGPADRTWRDPTRALADPRRKSPLLACILSAMPGLGQVYVGYYRQGFIHMAVWGSALAIAIAAGNSFQALLPPAVIFLVFFYLFTIIDAGRRASFYNQALAGIEGLELPTEMSLPSPGGSIAGGVALIIVGVILLSYTVFDMSLAWLEDWWPAAPILVGGWLIARGVQERLKGE